MSYFLGNKMYESNSANGRDIGEIVRSHVTMIHWTSHDGPDMRILEFHVCIGLCPFKT